VYWGQFIDRPAAQALAEEYEGTGRGELSTETENPARAEAAIVVRGGTVL
jgi:hypothetical protein